MRSGVVGVAGGERVKMAEALSVSGAGPEPEPEPEPEAEPPAGPDRVPEEDLPPLDPAEVRSRLEHSARQFRNRRKLLIRGLPADVSNQDVHELLKGYDLKYCFVDKYKGIAFITLLNADQASRAIQQFHGSKLRERELRVQLQPADAVLCVANLPRLLSQQHFEELLRPFGSLERCFLVYSQATGHSKGYGFVEFMKKDSAARARSELLGKQLGTRTLYVHWSEAAALSPELLHSRCLCVERLPRGFRDLPRLRRLFGAGPAPSFCQLAEDQAGRPRGFAVLEFGSAEEAELAQAATDGLELGGSRVRVSFCAPGPGGRSALAALLAARATARGRGLLPPPSAVQPPAQSPLQLLLLRGTRGILGAAPSLPLLPSPGIPSALLQLALHNQTQKPGILGDSPLGPRTLAKAPAPPPRKFLGEIPCGAPLGGALTPKVTLGGPPKIGATPKAGEGGASTVSLLGEPPKNLRVPLNPYLNLQSLLPPSRKGFQGNLGILGTPRIPPGDGAGPELHPDLGSRIFPQPRDPPGSIPGLFGHARNKALAAPPSSDPVPTSTPPNSHLKPSPGAPKRGFARLLPRPEPSPEGCYVGQHSQGLGGHYADSYLKRKRIF